jgi:tetratricopeptide (TPR) repeat protein
MDDIFALQDKITGQIVNALAVKLTMDEEKRFELKETINIEAYDLFLKGWQHYLHRTPKDFAEALPYFKKAVEIDPNYGRAYAALALTCWRGAGYGWARKMGMSYGEARVRARHYLEMAMKNPTSTAHRVASDMAVSRRHDQKALAEAKQAIALDPNNSENHKIMARVMHMVGKPEEAIAFAKRAMLLNPLDKAFPLFSIGVSRFQMGQYEEAVSLCERALENNPKATSIASILAAAYGQLGREPEARDALDRYLKGWGKKPSLPGVMYFFPFKNPEHADRFADGLIKAGLAGKPGGYYKISEKLRLSGEEIRFLFFGKKAIGFWGKAQWAVNRAKVGEATYRWGSKLIGSGKSWIKGDELCNQWEKLYGGLRYCSDVYRNPEGTPEEKNEYVIIDDKGIVGCSLEG